MRTDVTDKTALHFVDTEDELAWITRCVCGAKFKPWSQHISIYDTEAWECPECGARLCFSTTTRVFKIVYDEDLGTPKKDLLAPSLPRCPEIFAQDMPCVMAEGHAGPHKTVADFRWVTKCTNNPCDYHKHNDGSWECIHCGDRRKDEPR